VQVLCELLIQPLIPIGRSEVHAERNKIIRHQYIT
jgi:hypothetical protein